MPLTDEEEQKLREYMITLADRRTKLSEWEAGFFADQEKRYKEYGARMYLSPKQWAVLNRMYEKVTEA